MTKTVPKILVLRIMSRWATLQAKWAMLFIKSTLTIDLYFRTEGGQLGQDTEGFAGTEGFKISCILKNQPEVQSERQRK